MEIYLEKDKRVLKKDNNNLVNISDGDIISYTGIYYKKINEILDYVDIETSFIGKIECVKSRLEDGIMGFYVNPLYIYDIIGSKWRKIINYKPPRQKYFSYPHLLLLPDKYYHYKPIYKLESCKNVDLNDFSNITDTFDLNIE
jgi:hypothetical protein